MDSIKLTLSKDDPSSFSQLDECKITHLHLALDVDFTKRILNGSVHITAKKILSAAKRLILDTRDLKINSVTNAADKKSLKFQVGERVSSFGSPLVIDLPSDLSEIFTVVVSYETSPSSSALQWLSPEQTAGKRHPYLFSQCQAIHARSMVPCQDTPGVKMPYTATLRAPKELVALMSAIKKGSEPDREQSSRAVHQFEQTVPVPSYLIAIVVAALENRVIGPRSKVWSEKEMVDQAAYEFAETERMIATAEELLGPYVWGVYDLLILPPSFPYGGMENPCLTFVTPTCLAGDRSLASVVAHEVAHSWTGNLVTNKSPRHFWLNEGFTVFVERKILGRMLGENFRHLFASGGWTDLEIIIGGMHQPFTYLVPDLEGVDPDDAFSTVPYEKGSNLLMYLEEKLGGPEVFEPFLKAYVEEFKFKSITTDDWKAFLYKFFASKKAILDEVDWQAWFFTPGMPPVKPHYDTTLEKACSDLATKWSRSASAARDLDLFSRADLDALSTFQIKDFLNLLLNQPALSAEKIAKMEAVYSLNAVRNSEIRFRWLRLCIRARVAASVALALQFVSEQGRMKFVRPLYRDLYEWEESRARAIECYQRTKSQMHPVTATMVAKDLHLTS